MLIRRRQVTASIGAAAASLALSTATATAAPPVPADGTGSCSKRFCTVMAEHPAKPKPPSPPRLITNSSAGWSVKDETLDPSAPTQATQLQNVTAWDYHVNTLCTNARASGTAMPAECQPAPAQPAGAPPPTAQPGDATKRALQQLRPAPVKIGSAPCAMTAPDCVGGAVGAPVWLWTQPWTEQTATATAGPYTVTAVARPTSVSWDLGDGQRITCTTSGTPYELSWGVRDSPDCGTRYERVGRYAIAATMTYAVTWSGADTGSATIQSAPTSVPVDVREYQVVIHSNS